MSYLPRYSPLPSLLCLTLLLVPSAGAATTVSPQFRLDDPQRPAISAYDVTALPDGGWIAVWEDADLEAVAPGQAHRLVARRFQADGSALGDDWLVASDAPNSGPRLALREGDRTFCVAWRAVETLRLRCLALDPADAGEEVPEVEIAQLTGVEPAGHDVGPGAVIWSRRDLIARRELPAAAGPLPPQEVLGRAGNDQELIEPRFADGNHAWTVWTAYDTAEETAALVLPGYEGDPALHLAGAGVASLFDPLALAAWRQSRPDGFGFKVFAQSYTSGPAPPFQVARPAVLLDELDSGLVDGPAVAYGAGPADAPGFGVVLWSPNGGPNAFRLPLRVVDWKGTPAGPVVPLLAEAPADGWPVAPQLLRLADGRFLATWLIDPYGRPAPFGFTQDLHAAFVEAEPDDGSRLLLQDARFEVAVSWHDPYNGGSGFGQGASDHRRQRCFLVLPREQSGAAGQGARRPAGERVLVGVLRWPVDRRVHDHRLRSAGGPRRSYHNPPFELASRGDTTAFLADGAPPPALSVPARNRPLP